MSIHLDKYEIEFDAQDMVIIRNQGGEIIITLDWEDARMLGFMLIGMTEQLKLQKTKRPA